MCLYGISTSRPRPRRDSSPWPIHVAAAASPRSVSAEYRAAGALRDERHVERGRQKRLRADEVFLELLELLVVVEYQIALDLLLGQAPEHVELAAARRARRVDERLDEADAVERAEGPRRAAVEL